MIERYKKIAQEAARKILAEFEIHSAPVDVKEIIEKFGIRYIESSEIEDSLSGFFKRTSSDGKPVIVVNEKHGDSRKRFTAAHELGHFILHSMDDLFVDKKEEKVLFRKKDTSPFFDIKEVQANNFAAELLMPQNFLIEDLDGEIPTDLSEMRQKITKLSKKYKVSDESMMIRMGSFFY